MNENESELNLTEKLKNFSSSGLDALTKYRFVFIVIVIGLALMFALLRTNSFIDITRNETRFTEEVSKINYKEIDNEVLKELKASIQDSEITVNSNFDPNRQNPFNE